MIYVIEYRLQGDADQTTVYMPTLGAAEIEVNRLREEHGDKITSMVITNIENGVSEVVM